LATASGYSLMTPLNKEISKYFNHEILLNNWDSIYWELLMEKDAYYEDLLASIKYTEGIVFEDEFS